MDFKNWLDKNDTKKGAGSFITDGLSFLSLKYKTENNGSWTLPGGHIKRGETPLEGSIRETKEECGLEINKPFDKFICDNGYEIYFFYKKNQSCGKLSKEFEKHKWISFDEIKEFTFRRELEKTVDDLISVVKKNINENNSLNSFNFTMDRENDPNNRPIFRYNKKIKSPKANRTFGNIK